MNQIWKRKKKRKKNNFNKIEAVCDGGVRDEHEYAPLATRPSQLDVVASLVDKNLVRQSLAEPEPRFSLLETIRAFAVDQLEAAGEAAEVRRRHAEDVRQLVEAADPLLIGSDQVAWLERLEAEHGNLVAALTWARDTRAAAGETEAGTVASLIGLRIAGSLHWFWWLGGHVTEGRRWLAEMLTWDVGEAGQPARLRALYTAGTLELIQGAYDEAHRLLDAGASLAETLGDVVTRGRCLIYRGIVETYFAEAGRLDIDIPKATCRLAVATLEQTDDTWGQALALSQIGAHVRRDGDFARAETILRQSVDLAQSTGERYLLGSCLPKLGNLYRDLQDYEAADPLYRQALAAFRDIRELWWTGRCMTYLALTTYGLGEPHRAARLLGCSDAVLELGGARRNPHETEEYHDVTQRLVTMLGKAGFTAAWTEGRAMSLEQAVAFALDGAPSITGAA
jgi:tetratricopeptide (TPR) repeat protein